MGFDVGRVGNDDIETLRGQGAEPVGVDELDIVNSVVVGI
ncbi:MAG: hypothetical protein RL122_1251, partial [Pseudomonadota bacterium]